MSSHNALPLFPASLQLLPDSIDDLIYDTPNVGRNKVDLALRDASWIHLYLFDQWAPLSGEGFIDAHSALARILAVSAVIRSTNADDLAHALGLSRWFICLSIAILEAGHWRSTVLPELIEAVGGSDPSRNTKNAVDCYLETMEVSLHWVDLLKAVGTEIAGLGSKVCNPLGSMPPRRVQKHPEKKPTPYTLSRRGEPNSRTTDRGARHTKPGGFPNTKYKWHDESRRIWH